MRTITNPEHTRHDPPYEILDGLTKPYFEVPQRVAIISAALAAAGFPAPEPARAFGLEPLLAVHKRDYVEYIEQAHGRWVAAGLGATPVLPCVFPLAGLRAGSASPQARAGQYCFDLSAPITAGTYAAARGSADAALTAAALLLDGERSAYALCRPPGHHAAAAMAGGYCFFNNAAIAAHYLAVSERDAQALDKASPCGVLRYRSDGWMRRDQVPPHLPAGPQAPHPRCGSGQKGNLVTNLALAGVGVAVLDIDFHHGNGTQAIFYERSDVFCVSLHADPAREYPYFLGYADERGAHAGEGYNLNLPLPAGIDDKAYLSALETALTAISNYSPRYLVVSAGFDGFVADPLGDFSLSSAGFATIGQRIAQLGLPTLFVQEGGYAIDDLGRNLVSLLSGFAGA
jgi:acetoin utilization deacetylase AcuC-like enzyme